jgi:hypothetical protein
VTIFAASNLDEEHLTAAATDEEVSPQSIDAMVGTVYAT